MASWRAAHQAVGVGRGLPREIAVEVLDEKITEMKARLRKGSVGGRPPAFDAEIYKDRNVVERSFSLTKQWRGLATRDDKLALTLRAAAVLHACIHWLRLWGDTAQVVASPLRSRST